MKHAVAHVGKQHACSYCDVQFSTVSNMNAHVRKKHANEASLKHECRFCFKAFDSARGLSVHQTQSQKCSLYTKHFKPNPKESASGSAEVDEFESPKTVDALTKEPIAEKSQPTRNGEENHEHIGEGVRVLPAIVTASHSTIVFVTCRGGTGQDDDDACSIERSCFIIISMAEFFRRGHGCNTKLTVIIPRGISDDELQAASTCLGLVDEWNRMKTDSVLYFDTYETLVNVFRLAKSRHCCTPSNVTSLLVIGHGGFDRCQILYGGRGDKLKKPSHLMALRLCGLIDISGAKIVHLMTCKAGKLMVTMTQTKRAIFNELHNDDTAFVAYGIEDITTVPVQISSGNLRFTHPICVYLQKIGRCQQ